MKVFWDQRHNLPDSLTTFMEQLEARMPADFKEQSSRTLLNETAGVFDTHPTAAQRIRRTRQRADPGLFALERPARALFQDFDEVSKVITRSHYLRALGIPATSQTLKPVAEFFADQGESETARQPT
jgi:hypothetical protein